MKPVLQKNYGSIGHLPNSRLGEGDHSLNEAQASILTDKARDYKDLIIVQEKLDGANVGIMRHEGRLIGLTRKGHRCIDSPLEQFQMFQRWIIKHQDQFEFLLEGERLVGEWVAMAHGTKYRCDGYFNGPFYAFDLFDYINNQRFPYLEFLRRVGMNIPIAKLLHIGSPISTKKIDKMIDKRDGETYGFHGALEPVEGAVWRVEREGKVDFLGKYVRQWKQDGKYFNEDHTQLVWNWQP